MEVTVTKADYENSSKEFCDNLNCPLCMALKRSFNTNNVIVGTDQARINGKYYSIDPEFDANAFDNLECDGTEISLSVIPS